jgi:hypothetical protein
VGHRRAVCASGQHSDGAQHADADARRIGRVENPDDRADPHTYAFRSPGVEDSNSVHQQHTGPTSDAASSRHPHADQESRPQAAYEVDVAVCVAVPIVDVEHERLEAATAHAGTSAPQPDANRVTHAAQSCREANADEDATP